MNAYLDRNYGADADGNRGIPVWEYEIEPSDREHILDYLKDFLTEFDPIVESLPEVLEIPFINPITEDDISIDVYTDPYIDDLRVYKLITNDNYESVINSLIEFNRPLALKLSIQLIAQLSNNK